MQNVRLATVRAVFAMAFLLGELHSQDPIRRWEVKTDNEIDAIYGKYAGKAGAAVQRKKLEQIHARIEDAVKLPHHEAIPTLTGILGDLCARGLMIPERIPAFERTQALLSEIPGHARYFGDQVKGLQNALKGTVPQAIGSGKRYDYNQSRTLWIGRLRLMQTPESVQVLGEFLWDETDTPPPPVPGTFEANCDLACRALSESGLRDSPQIIPYTISPHDRVFWREWYTEVKGGRKAFSFIGKNVEYRFKPDGTWETIAMQNPPDDGKLPAVEARNAEPASTTHQARTVEQPEPQPGDGQWWLVGIGAAVVAVLGCLLRSRWKGSQ
jgi:hypothetical protein